MVIYVRNRAGYDAAFKSVTGMVGKDISERGRKLASLARRQVGKDTFKLVRSIKSNVGVRGGEVEATVGSNVSYARLHHDGSVAHYIRARNAKRLRFVQRGRVRYATAVWHPGTKPNRYLTDNLSKVV